MNRQLLAVLVAASLCAGVLGCGGDDEKGGGTATTGGTTTGAEETTTGEEKKNGETTTGGETTELTSSTVKVNLVDVALEPANPKVKPGTVTFRMQNRGTLLHAIRVETPAGRKSSAPIVPFRSATLRVKLDKPGKYDWWCPIDGHRKLGMKGKITVR